MGKSDRLLGGWTDGKEDLAPSLAFTPLFALSRVSFFPDWLPPFDPSVLPVSYSGVRAHLFRYPLPPTEGVPWSLAFVCCQRLCARLSSFRGVAGSLVSARCTLRSSCWKFRNFVSRSFVGRPRRIANLWNAGRRCFPFNRSEPDDGSSGW